MQKRRLTKFSTLYQFPMLGGTDYAIFLSFLEHKCQKPTEFTHSKAPQVSSLLAVEMELVPSILSSDLKCNPSLFLSCSSGTDLSLRPACKSTTVSVGVFACRCRLSEQNVRQWLFWNWQSSLLWRFVSKGGPSCISLCLMMHSLFPHAVQREIMQGSVDKEVVLSTHWDESRVCEDASRQCEHVRGNKMKYCSISLYILHDPAGFCGVHGKHSLNGPGISHIALQNSIPATVNSTWLALYFHWNSKEILRRIWLSLESTSWAAAT